MDADNIYEFDNGHGRIMEVFEPAGDYTGPPGIGFLVAGGEECATIVLPYDEAWTLMGSLSEALT